MSKILFVGDLHLSIQSPISRKEDNETWRKLQIAKLKYIYDYAEDIHAECVIYAGDIFNSSSINMMSGQHLIDIVSIFKRLPSYTIIGNHDMYFRNDDMFNYTILGLMFSVGVLKHLDKMWIDDVLIQGTDYLKEIPALDKSDILTKPDYAISVSHQLYENSQWASEENSNLTDLEAKTKGYNAYFLGHDHNNYEPALFSDYILLRPGSILRGTSKFCNLYRPVQFYIFDTEVKEWYVQNMPVADGLSVFKDKVVLEKQQKVNLADIIQKLSFKTESTVLKIIEQNRVNGKEQLKELYDEVESLINTYCTKHGIH